MKIVNSWTEENGHLLEVFEDNTIRESFEGKSRMWIPDTETKADKQSRKENS